MPSCDWAMPDVNVSVASFEIRRVRTTKNESLIVPRDDKYDPTILVPLLIVVRDDQSFRDLREAFPIVDDPDKGATQRVHCFVGGRLERTEARRVDNVLCIVLLE